MTQKPEAAAAPPWFAPLAWGGVPPPATAVVWLGGLAIFALFSFRLVFTTVVQRALPGLDAFWWLPPLAVLCVALGWFLGGRAVLAFLVVLPGLAAVNGARLVTVWLLPEIVFSCVLAGWLTHRVFTRRLFRVPRQWPDLAVGCLFLTLCLSAIWAALVPSAVDGLSIAFSIPSWSDKSEFNFLEMTHALAGGCVIFLLLRTLAAEAPEKFAGLVRRAFLAQFSFTALLAVGSAVISLARTGAVTRDLIWLPFGAIQLSAGPACLFGGYFAGGLFTRSRLDRLRLADLAAPGAALAGMVLSTSKIAWLAAAVLGGAIVHRFFRWRGLVLCAAGLIVFSVVVTGWIAPRFSGNPIAHEAGILLNAQDWGRQGTAVERVMLWDTAGRMAARYPLTGLGLGSFSSAEDRFARNGFYGTLDWKAYSYPPFLHSTDPVRPGTCYNAYYAHNDFLEIATGSGLPSALLFALICGLAIVTGFRSSRFAEGDRKLGRCGACALAAFLPISLFDSRLLYFANSVLFWQFAALCFPRPAGFAPSAPASKRFWLPPLAVPAVFAAAAAFLFAAGRLPSDRTFGVWNWRQQTVDGYFLLAREAQFLVPPTENLDSLLFQLPWDAGEGPMRLTVTVDGAEVARPELRGRDRFRLRLAPYRRKDRWTEIHILADRWLGRGFMGTPLGMKPVSFSMKKIRPRAGTP